MTDPQTTFWDTELTTAVRPARKASKLASAEVRAGDAFDLVRQLPRHSIDLIITSPPYWGLRTYSADHNWEIADEWTASGATGTIPSYEWYVKHGGVLGLEPNPDWYVAYIAEFFELARSCLKPSGSIWLNIGDTYFARWASIRDQGRQGLDDSTRKRRRVPMGDYRQEKQLLLIPARAAIAMQSRRWILRNDVIWHKPNVPPRPERDRLKLAHEHFFHFVHRPVSGRAKYFYDISMTEPRSNDVVSVNVRSGQDDHSATFPESLIEPRIRSSCMPGGTVLDPFAGTGRALVCAVRNGMNAIGFEKSRRFAAAATRSLQEATRL
jgi:site-specific DNA-methyltransferase (cytosine-N4-specific)